MILISGITSGLGISLAQQLVSKGYRVRGFARNIEKAKGALSHPMIELFSGDLLDANFVAKMCDQVDGVVHAAALSTPWGREEEYFKVNVEGTEVILREGFAAGIKSFVHVSTPSLYFDFSDRLNIIEASPLPAKGANAYAITKKMAEERVDRAAREGAPVITIRPRAIFGPHDQTVLPRVLKVCSKKGIPMFSRTSPLIDVTYVENVAHAIYLALEADARCFGEKYNITNGEPIALWALLNELLGELSIQRRERQIPYWIAYSAAWLGELRAHLTKKEPDFTRYSVGLMRFSQTLSIEKARKELNYQPIVSLKEGIRRYVKWIQTS